MPVVTGTPRYENGFFVFAMDGESGNLSLNHVIDLPAQHWQLCISPDRRFLYQRVRDRGYSGVLTFRVDPATGGVMQVGEVELEADVCYVATDKTGRFCWRLICFRGWSPFTRSARTARRMAHS